MEESDSPAQQDNSSDSDSVVDIEDESHPASVEVEKIVSPVRPRIESPNRLSSPGRRSVGGLGKASPGHFSQPQVIEPEEISEDDEEAEEEISEEHKDGES